jgi:hypothetical protein
MAGDIQPSSQIRVIPEPLIAAQLVKEFHVIVGKLKASTALIPKTAIKNDPEHRSPASLD